MKTTREADLELLELARDNAGDASRKAKHSALLESVYYQAQDKTLEKMRNELAYWINYGLQHAPEGILPPTLEQKRAMALAEQNIERLEKQVQEYASSPAFQTEMLTRMNRHDPLKVEALVAQQKRRLL